MSDSDSGWVNYMVAYWLRAYMQKRAVIEGQNLCNLAHVLLLFNATCESEWNAGPLHFIFRLFKALAVWPCKTWRRMSKKNEGPQIRRRNVDSITIWAPLFTQFFVFYTDRGHFSRRIGKLKFKESVNWVYHFGLSRLKILIKNNLMTNEVIDPVLMEFLSHPDITIDLALACCRHLNDNGR